MTAGLRLVQDRQGGACWKTVERRRLPSLHLLQVNFGVLGNFGLLRRDGSAGKRPGRLETRQPSLQEAQWLDLVSH
jgi:hypothetical protein